MLDILISCTKKINFNKYKVVICFPNHPTLVHLNLTAQNVIDFVQGYKEQICIKYENFGESLEHMRMMSELG
jgi:hypothetical protein